VLRRLLALGTSAHVKSEERDFRDRFERTPE